MSAVRRGGSAQRRWLFYAMLGCAALLTVTIPLTAGLLSGRGWKYYAVLALLEVVLVGLVARVIFTYSLSGAAAGRLSASEQRLNRLYETMACGVVVWDGSLNVTHVNQGAARILRLRPGEQVWDEAGASGWTVTSEDGLELTARDRPSAVALRTGQSQLSCTLGLSRPGAETIWIQGDMAPLLDARAAVEHIVFSFVDITRRKQAEDNLAYQAMHDGLTGLPNRTLLLDRVRQAILAARRDERRLALMVMDLDRFKEVNDAFGHHYGDLLLAEIGPRLASALRESDTVARLGGDEFAVLLPGSGGAEGAAQAAEKIMAALQRQFLLEGQAVDIGASIGIALYPEHGEDVETLLRRADVAMYAAKRERVGCSIYGDEQVPHGPSGLTPWGGLTGTRALAGQADGQRKQQAGHHDRAGNPAERAAQEVRQGQNQRQAYQQFPAIVRQEVVRELNRVFQPVQGDASRGATGLARRLAELNVRTASQENSK